MKNGQTVSLKVEAIENGYLVSAEKREGYRNVVTGQTYYATIADIEGDLADVMDRASGLEIPAHDEDEGPF